ncbi:MAG: hypothetical protein WAM05_03705 [Candidatus Binataceae bacterium]
MRADDPNPGADTTGPVPRKVSLLRYSPALVALVIALADTGRFTDPDLWWHLRSGQEILRLGHPVFHDPYSYSAPGHLWLNHEWLADAILAAFYNLLGVFGLKLLKLCCTGATVLMMAAALSETGATTVTQLALLILATIAIEPQMQFRPQMFTFALMSAMVALFARDIYRRGGKLWIAIPILALWANLHGGFLMGIVALAIYAGVSGLQDCWAEQGTRRGLMLSAIWVGALAATLATPYGLGTWNLLAHALANPYTRSTLADWKPITHAIASAGFSPVALMNYAAAIAIVLGLGVLCILRPAAIDLPLVAIAATMAAAGYMSVRNLPLAVITAIVPLAYHLSLGADRRVGFSVHAISTEARPNLFGQSGLALLTLYVLFATGFFSRTLRFDEPYPNGALAFMDQHHLEGNILCSYGWGGYLIFHAGPQTRLFIDPRFDTVYPMSVIGDYLAFHYDQPGATNALDRYPTSYVLIKPTLPAAGLMDSLPGWKLVYRDKDSLLYARASTAASSIPGVPVSGGSRAQVFP